MQRTIKIAVNQKNKRVALLWQPTGYSVWIESENYQLGDYRKSWGYVKRYLIFTEAEKLFDKKIAGKR